LPPIMQLVIQKLLLVEVAAPNPTNMLLPLVVIKYSLLSIE